MTHKKVWVIAEFDTTYEPLHNANVIKTTLSHYRFDCKGYEDLLIEHYETEIEAETNLAMALESSDVGHMEFKIYSKWVRK